MRPLCCATGRPRRNSYPLRSRRPTTDDQRQKTASVICPTPNESTTARPYRRARGFSLVELLAAMLLLTFMVAVTGRLYQVGQRQQQTARVYSQNQTDARKASRTLTRTIRHGYGVIGTSAAGNLVNLTSGTNAIIVETIEAGGGSRLQIRFHVSNGILYGQRQEQTAPGSAILENVQSLSFKYFQVFGDSRTELLSGYDVATDVEFRLTLLRNGISTATVALVGMRNANSQM